MATVGVRGLITDALTAAPPRHPVNK